MPYSASLIQLLPKAELHVHIEGTLEPSLLLKLASRNNISVPYSSVDDLRNAYAFRNLQSFLDIYYAGANVLRTEEDFYDLTKAYLSRCYDDNVRHSEIMFDPQTHTSRGIPIATVFSGIARALREAKTEKGFSSSLIMSFLRHLSEESAIETLNAALPLREEYNDLWNSIGLDSSEMGHPPEKFARVYKRCKELGFHLVAHAGEEGPPQYVWDALDILHVERIDHGVRSEEDPSLLKRLIYEKIPLTVCPLSNLKLKVIQDMSQSNLGRLLRAGCVVTVNADDPAYFGGYLNDNYIAVADALDLSNDDIISIAKNGFLASFISEAKKQSYLDEIDTVVASLGGI